MKRPISDRRAPVVARLSTAALLAGLFALPVLAGCPGSLGTGPWPPATGSTGGATGMGTGGASGMGTGGNTGACDAPTTIFMPKCSASSCHGPTGPFPPDFSKLDALKTTKASTSTMSCAMKPIVDPATPTMTVLMARISGTTCGERMPDKAIDSTVTYLTQPEIDCVSNWVASYLQ